MDPLTWLVGRFVVWPMMARMAQGIATLLHEGVAALSQDTVSADHLRIAHKFGGGDTREVHHDGDMGWQSRSTATRRDPISGDRIASDAPHWRCSRCETWYTETSRGYLIERYAARCTQCGACASLRHVVVPRRPGDETADAGGLSGTPFTGRNARSVHLEGKVLHAWQHRSGVFILLELPRGDRAQDRIPILLAPGFVARWKAEPTLLELGGRRVRCTGRFHEFAGSVPGVVAESLEVLAPRRSDAASATPRTPGRTKDWGHEPYAGPAEMTRFAVRKGWPRGCFRRKDRSGLQWGFPPADHDIVSRLQRQISDWDRVRKAVLAKGNTEPIRLAQPIAVHVVWDGDHVDAHPPR